MLCLIPFTAVGLLSKPLTLSILPIALLVLEVGALLFSERIFAVTKLN
jgi:hypothetical protein